MTFAALSVLYALSQPFDTYRFCLFIGEWILTLIAIFGFVPYPPFSAIVFSNYKNLLNNKTMILVAILYAVGSPLITSCLMNGFNFLTRGDVSPTETRALDKKQ